MNKLQEILDWQTRFLIRESVLQDISSTKKLHLTEEMMMGAKSEAQQQILQLVQEIIGEDDPSTNYNYPSEEKQLQNLENGDRNKLRLEQRQRAKELLG